MVAVLPNVAAGARRAMQWGKGCFWPGEAPPKAVPDVVISHSMVGGDVHGEIWTLAVGLERLVSKSVGVDGRVVEVQNFRMVWTDGDPRRLACCGTCGMLAWYASAEWHMHMPIACRRCGAAASERRCATGHAFGECPSCGPGMEGVP